MTQLTDKKCKQWMIKEGIYDHWLIPVNGCNAGTIYFGRPVGNTPEVMPWDESLNKDVHDKVKEYASLSSHVKKEDQPELWAKRFCTANQKQMLNSYMRVLHPDTGVCPTSERIVADFCRCWGENIDAIVKCRGTYVANLGSRNGHRVLSGVDSRGGHRVKKPWKGVERMHPDAQEIWDFVRQQSKDKCSTDNE